MRGRIGGAAARREIANARSNAAVIMCFRIEQDDSRNRERFGDYTYRIYDGDRLVARYSHDYRGDDHGIEFLWGVSNEGFSFDRLADFIGGGGPEPIALTERAIAYLKSKRR
jgi:hypothetical protein